MSTMNFVPCIKWVSKGMAKSNPEKIKISPSELKELIEAEKRKEEEEEEEAKNEENEETDDEYDMKNYDKDDSKTLQGAVGIGSIALLEEEGAPGEGSSTSRFQRPIKLDESDSELENEVVRADDNLLLVGHVQDELSILEVYIYNNESKDLYVHHDILLPSVPLCFEWLGYDPQAPEGTGNLCIVGDMTPVIKVWDLDIIDCLKPAFTLGKKKSEGYKHTDAVLDIAWNKHLPHILASGGVDKRVLLWDLDDAVATTKMKHSDDKIQILKWHPHESHTLLTGSCDEHVRIYDCRGYDLYMKWKLDGEIEKGIWNTHCPFSCYIGTNNGIIYNIDVRNSKPVWSIKAFEEEITGLYTMTSQSDRLYTCSNGEVVKVYSHLNSEPKLVKQKGLSVGEVLCIDGNPDYPNIVCLGGTKRCKNLTVLDFDKKFNSEEADNEEVGEEEEEDEDSDVDDVEEFFGVNNQKKKSKKRKSDGPKETFKPEPFSHLNEIFSKTKDPSLIKKRKFMKKQKQKVKKQEHLQKKKKQEKFQRQNDKNFKKNKNKT